MSPSELSAQANALPLILAAVAAAWNSMGMSSSADCILKLCWTAFEVKMLSASHPRYNQTRARTQEASAGDEGGRESVFFMYGGRKPRGPDREKPRSSEQLEKTVKCP